MNIPIISSDYIIIPGSKLIIFEWFTKIISEVNTNVNLCTPSDKKNIMMVNGHSMSVKSIRMMIETDVIFTQSIDFKYVIFYLILEGYDRSSEAVSILEKYEFESLTKIDLLTSSFDKNYSIIEKFISFDSLFSFRYSPHQNSVRATLITDDCICLNVSRIK